MASSDCYEAMALRRYLFVYSWLKMKKKKLKQFQSTYQGYQEQNCIIYFLVMQQTDRVLLTVMALYNRYEAMEVSRRQLVFSLLRMYLSFTQCIQNQVPNIPLRNCHILWSVSSTYILPLSIAKKTPSGLHYISPQCTIRSGLHEIPTMIMTFPFGLKNNHACKQISDNFSRNNTFVQEDW